jgi:riboflavin kinase/FMN adenylyltransferase
MATTIDWDQMPPEEFRHGVVAIGNFDGVHCGHSSLIQETCRQAAAISRPAVALTFDPHPREVLAPTTAPPLLTTPADRWEMLQNLGAWVLILRTTQALLSLSAADFFHQVVRQRLAVAALVEGHNFGFGHNREGTVETLAALCREDRVPLTVVPPLVIEGQAVSSSRVRQALLGGAVAEAALLLGRPYRLRGRVGTGQRRGRTLGFPTANVEDIATLIPRDGVYAVRVWARQRSWPGAANIGPNPTFAEQQRKVEVHLIGFDGDLYGQPLSIDFVEHLRDTRPFGSAAELVSQLRKDVEQAQRIAGTLPT